MSEKTNIEWATSTASPWFGCSKVSPGCTNCYAEALTLKNKWAGWGDNSPRVRSKGFWTEAYRLNKKAERDRLAAADRSLPFERPRMFTSLMDWLDPQAPIKWLADFLKVVRDCRNLDWLLLTKRPENFQERLMQAFEQTNETARWIPDWVKRGIAPANVWFGVTVENQAMADKRIPLLLSIPARVRWLSVEPLLESVDFTSGTYASDGNGLVWDAFGKPAHIPYRYSEDHGGIIPDGPAIHWIVVGGESGPNRRDCGVEAIHDVVADCKTAGVPVFVKQDCAFRPGQQGRIPDHIWDIKQYPKPSSLQPPLQGGVPTAPSRSGM